MKNKKGEIGMLKEIFDDFSGKSKADKTKEISTGIVVGGAIGFITGILIAPQSGEKTRRDIQVKSKQVASDVKEDVEGKIDEIKVVGDKAAQDLKIKTKKIKNSIEGIKRAKDELVLDTRLGFEYVKDDVEGTKDTIQRNIEEIQKEIGKLKLNIDKTTKDVGEVVGEDLKKAQEDLQTDLESFKESLEDINADDEE